MNSNGLMKSAYQRELDKQGIRIIREKNGKDGKMKQHKVFKGMNEEQSEEFNNKYDDYSHKSGFIHDLKKINQRLGNKNEMRQITDGNHNLNRKTHRN